MKVDSAGVVEILKPDNCSLNDPAVFCVLLVAMLAVVIKGGMRCGVPLTTINAKAIQNDFVCRRKGRANDFSASAALSLSDIQLSTGRNHNKNSYAVR